jgi:DNA-binding beta-propeller fold protein YncE
MNPFARIEKSPRRISRTPLPGFVLLWSAFSLVAGYAHAGAPQLVWPPPPDEPRIAYVQSISQPADAGVKASMLHRLSNWVLGTREDGGSLNRPFGIALDEAGDFCVTDTGANAVCYFDRAAKHWYRWEQVGGIHFASPVAVAKEGKTLYVADSALAAIIVFDLDGNLLFRITEGLTRPTGLAISGDRLLVADAAAHCIDIFDLRGKFLSRFGARGTGEGQFNFPTHVTSDSHGNIYVTDSMNSRVQVFDAKGSFERQIGGAGDGPGTFSRPKGVAVDGNGRAYVVDAMFGNVQIFDSTGQLLLDFGHPGAGPGEFWLPNGIAFGRDNHIYVADSYNGRVQVFKYVGQQ